MTDPEDGSAGRELDFLIAKHEQEWHAAAVAHSEPAYFPVIFAAAELLGVPAEALAWRVEAVRGFEPHDAFYQDVVIAEALRLSDLPSAEGRAL